MKDIRTQGVIFVILAIFIAVPVHTWTVEDTQPEPVAVNIILMIGDGMGFEHVKAGSFYLTGEAGNLSFEPYYVCPIQTHARNAEITDSAAAGSALATGVKGRLYVISTAPDGTPYETILEYAKSLGKSTGLVTNTPITHATPATFGAHQPSRANFIEIGNDFLHSSRPNIIFGGGDPTEEDNGYFEAYQMVYAQSIGYQLVRDCTEMINLYPSNLWALGLFAPKSMTFEYDRPPNSSQPHLSQMTAKALEILSEKPRGFFLMVEGGILDGAGHANHIQRLVHEVVEFHNTVQVALDWIEGRDDTLLIVVADHETGGLTVENQGAGNYPSATWTTGGHTAADVPLYATGVGMDIVDQVASEGPIHLIDVHRIMRTAILKQGEYVTPFLCVQ